MNLPLFYAFLLFIGFMVGIISAWRRDRAERRRLEKTVPPAIMGDGPKCAGTSGTSAGAEGNK